MGVMGVKFKVGDKVKIRSNPSEPDSAPFFLYPMRQYIGKEVEIAMCWKEGMSGGYWYKINEDGKYFTWAQRWLEPSDR